MSSSVQLEALCAPGAEETTKTQANRLLRRVFSFPVVLGALLVLLTVFTVRSRFSDPDLWYHLKIGEIIWNTHSIPRVDSFSFTANGHAWVAQEWLSQLTMYGAYKLGGYSGLMLWLWVLSSALILGAYLLCTLHSQNPKIAFVGGMLTWLFSTIGLAIRPHILGYVFLVCELILLHLGRSRDRRWLLALPPLFALWINCHGSFFLGLIVLAVAVLFAFTNFRVGLLVAEPLGKRCQMMLVAAFVFSIAALGLNPLGFRLIFNPVEVMGKLHMNLTQVAEWKPTNLDDIRGVALFGVAGLILILPLLRRTELPAQEVLLLLLGFGFAAQHSRMLFVFGILVPPIFCRMLAGAWDRYHMEMDRVLPNVFMMALLTPLIVLLFPSARDLKEQVERGNPVKALEYIGRAGLSGRMLNEYVYGGYLIWAAPQYKVFIDGRGDIFELTGIFAEYGEWLTVQADPKVLLDKYHIDFCLLSRDAPVTHVLPLLPGWKMVYSDASSSVFARQRPI